MNAKQRYLERMEEKHPRHRLIAQQLVPFILSLCFLGISLVFIGVCHAPISWTASVANMGLSVIAVITLQVAVVCSSFAVNSTRYAIHVISCVSLSVSLALDVALAVYYFLLIP